MTSQSKPDLGEDFSAASQTDVAMAEHMLLMSQRLVDYTVARLNDPRTVASAEVRDTAAKQLLELGISMERISELLPCVTEPAKAGTKVAPGQIVGMPDPEGSS